MAIKDSAELTLTLTTAQLFHTSSKAPLALFTFTVSSYLHLYFSYIHDVLLYFVEMSLDLVVSAHASIERKSFESIPASTEPLKR